MNRNSKILIPFMLPVSFKRGKTADNTQAVSMDKDLIRHSAPKEESAGLADRDNAVTKKRRYQKMTVTPIATGVERCILVGSNTHVDIELGGISVTEFEDDTEISTEGYDLIFNM